MIYFSPERLGDLFSSREVGCFFVCHKKLGDFFLVPRGLVIFFVPRGWVIFFCPERLVDIFCPVRLGDFFLVPRGLGIFFRPERFGDFLSCREVG